MPTVQITVRARDCLRRPWRPAYIGDVLTYRGQDWAIVGLFMGADPITSEIEEYLVIEVIEGRSLEDRSLEGSISIEEEGRETRGRVS